MPVVLRVAETVQSLVAEAAEAARAAACAQFIAKNLSLVRQLLQQFSLLVVVTEETEPTELLET